MMMNEFMAMLKKNENEHPPPTKLLNLAGELCQEHESSSPSLEKLVEAMMESKNKRYFLTNIHVVRAFVSVHIHKGQHDAACRLLEYCKAEEKEELVQLWHEIHYRRVMEKHQTDALTPLQKFRCRKRNPPPISLCPEGLKNRNYSEKVRQHLYRFATEVTANPDKKQREGLARDMNLQPTQVYNWFANYRRRQKSRRLDVEELNNSCPERALASHTNEPQDKGSNTPQTADEPRAGVSLEQTEITPMPCEPGWEQSAPEGTYLKMLESSCVWSPELCEVGTSVALFNTPSAEQPVPFGTGAVMEAGTCFGSPILLPGEAVTRAAASPWQGSFVLHSYESRPFPNYWLPVWWAPYSTRGVSGSVWTPGVEVHLRLCLTSLSAHLFLHPVWKKAKPWDKARSWRNQLLTL
ncbi:anomalous homeobox protein isoform X2 [Cinclus cinclus]|uniref:anomalous homeobox protein isoform X2 n=1 Tax=Cinclus cinclus TaxID=127875 RepID=UPI002E0D4E66